MKTKEKRGFWWRSGFVLMNRWKMKKKYWKNHFWRRTNKIKPRRKLFLFVLFQNSPKHSKNKLSTKHTKIWKEKLSTTFHNFQLHRIRKQNETVVKTISFFVAQKSPQKENWAFPSKQTKYSRLKIFIKLNKITKKIREVNYFGFFHSKIPPTKKNFRRSKLSQGKVHNFSMKSWRKKRNKTATQNIYSKISPKNQNTFIEVNKNPKN